MVRFLGVIVNQNFVQHVHVS